VAKCNPHDGDAVSFWDDLILDTVFSAKYPSLYSFSKQFITSLKSVRGTERLVDLFRIPMTRQAHNELLLLTDDILEIRGNNIEGKDEWIFIWGSHDYSVKRFYQHHFHAIRPPVTILWMWKAKCVPRIKFFAWLLLNDRLNTRNMLRRRRKFLENYNCPLCADSVEETLEHLFFDCPCAATRWFKLGIVWDDEAPIHQKIQLAKSQFHFPFFMEVFMIAAWCLWNERNSLVFNGRAPGLNSWLISFKKEVEAHLFRIKNIFHSSIRQWLASL
jgi:hypothetical protein